MKKETADSVKMALNVQARHLLDKKKEWDNFLEYYTLEAKSLIRTYKKLEEEYPDSSDDDESGYYPVKWLSRDLYPDEEYKDERLLEMLKELTNTIYEVKGKHDGRDAVCAIRTFLERVDPKLEQKFKTL